MPVFHCPLTNETFFSEQAFHHHCLTQLLDLELNTLYQERSYLEEVIRERSAELYPELPLEDIEFWNDHDWIIIETKIICYKHALHTHTVFPHSGAWDPFTDLAIKFADQLGITNPPEPVLALDIHQFYEDVNKRPTPEDYANNSINVCYQNSFRCGTSQEQAEQRRAIQRIYHPRPSTSDLFGSSDSDSDSDSDDTLSVASGFTHPLTIDLTGDSDSDEEDLPLADGVYYV